MLLEEISGQMTVNYRLKYISIKPVHVHYALGPHVTATSLWHNFFADIIWKLSCFLTTKTLSMGPMTNFWSPKLFFFLKFTSWIWILEMAGASTKATKIIMNKNCMVASWNILAFKCAVLLCCFSRSSFSCFCRLPSLFCPNPIIQPPC